jgi:DNA polymerase-3 subunit delta
MIKIVYSENNDFIDSYLKKNIEYKSTRIILTPETIIDFFGTIDSYNLFKEQSSYIIEGCDFFSIKSTKYHKNSISQLLSIVSKSDDQFIFILEKKVNKTISYYKDFYEFIEYLEIKDDQNHFNKLLNEFIKDNNIIINDQTLSYLVNACNQNLILLEQELLKLQTFSNNQEITNEAVKAIGSIQVQSNAFNLVNYLLFDQQQKASLLYDEMINEGQNPVSLIALLASQIRFIRQVKIIGQSEQNTASILKTSPYRVKFTKQVTNKLTIEKINNLYSKIADIDYNIKTGKTSDQLILFYLLK